MGFATLGVLCVGGELLKFYRITRLGRPFDLSETSNRIAAFGPVAVALGSLGWDIATGDTLELIEALWNSITAFLAWAIARELDPDRPNSATLALALAGLAVIVGPWQAPILISAAALLGLRVLAGTVGGELKPLDLVVVVGLAVFAGTRIDGWIIVLLLVLGLLDSRPEGYLLALPAMLVGATVAGYIADPGLPSRALPDEVWLWSLITVVAVVLAVRQDRIRTRTDIFDHPIRWPNVRAARVMAGFVVIGGLLASTSGEVVLLVPVLAALMAVASIRTFGPA